MASLFQRLFAMSGNAGYGDLPWLYGQLALARARAAAAAQGQDFQGEPMKQQLAAASGAAPIGNALAGLFPPEVPAIAGPGRGGGGAQPSPPPWMQNDRGRSEGGGYGAGVNNQGDRYRDVYSRGQAPATPEGLLAAAGNAYNLMGPGIVQTGLASMGEIATGQPPGAWGGIQNIPGYIGPNPVRRRSINSLNDLFAAQEADRVNARVARGGYYSGRGYGGPPSRGGGNGGFGGGGGAFGRGAARGPADTGGHQGGPRSGLA